MESFNVINESDVTSKDSISSRRGYKTNEKQLQKSLKPDQKNFFQMDSLTTSTDYEIEQNTDLVLSVCPDCNKVLKITDLKYVINPSSENSHLPDFRINRLYEFDYYR